MIFHHSQAVKLVLNEQCQGDMTIYNQLKNYTTPKKIDIEVGVWANYHGYAFGEKPGIVIKRTTMLVAITLFISAIIIVACIKLSTK